MRINEIESALEFLKGRLEISLNSNAVEDEVKALQVTIEVLERDIKDLKAKL